ncbi:MAG TPA: SAM-dependent methyltransferase, partial [Elusimicrobiota bacterium]|nr:SAM-dependent methyltransferase [Elusimicrobiota bacterium]
MAETGAKAQALILAGKVRAPGLKNVKPGEKVRLDQEIELVADLPYVSRGGEKLAAALDEFGVTVAGRFCLDVGASTGGFTDCLLQRGAVGVLAVDVGHGQLHWKLRNDPRVENLEKTHARDLTADR